MKLVAPSAVRELVDASGGSVYIWARTVGCCRGRSHVLEASTVSPDRDFELVHASAGLSVYATRGLRLPAELHLELDRRRSLRAFWNGQAWIG